MDDSEFEAHVRSKIAELAKDQSLDRAWVDWLVKVAPYQYTYFFRWLGVPVIQLPQDLVAMQELVWSLKPDVIIETGVARGGSLIFYASMLQLLDGDGIVIGVDIDIREHTRKVLDSHPMAKRVRTVEGSSIDPATVARVRDLVGDRKRVIVVLDSMHTHAHVLEELRQYAPFVNKDSYLVVFDTTIEVFPKEYFADRPWAPGDNALTAVREFLTTTDRFVVDHTLHQKLQFTAAFEGYLRCVKD